MAYALQRVEDPRAAPALVQLLQVPGRYTAAFAARGLGVLKHTAAADSLTAMLDPKTKAPLEVVVSAIRALGQMNVPAAGAKLAAVASDPGSNPNVRLEALSALGAMKSSEGLAVAQDLLTDDWPALRAAALRAAAAIDPEAFTFVLSGLEPDRDWRVRAAMAETLGSLSPAVALERAHAMLEDSDQRVIAAVLGALVKLHAPDAVTVLTEQLKAADFAVRAAAAEGLATLKPPDGAAALREAYAAAQPDSAYVARGAILKALTAYGPADATETLKTALAARTGRSGARGRAPEARSGNRRAKRHQAGARDAGRALRRSAAGCARDLAARVRRDRARHDRVRARCARRAADLAQLHGAGAQGILRRPADPPGGGEFRRAGRRSTRRR